MQLTRTAVLSSSSASTWASPSTPNLDAVSTGEGNDDGHDLDADKPELDDDLYSDASSEAGEPGDNDSDSDTQTMI